MLTYLKDKLLRREYNVRYVWLFGSFVQGKQHRHSDLDVLVEWSLKKPQPFPNSSLWSIDCAKSQASTISHPFEP